MPMGDTVDSPVSDAFRDTEAFLDRRLLVDLESAKAQSWRAEEQLSRYSQLKESVCALDAQVLAFQAGTGTVGVEVSREHCLTRL